MRKDYEVFQPSDERIAQIITNILVERGYNAGYQLGYPHNKVFIKVDNGEEADKISSIIRQFMKKYGLSDTEITTVKLNILIRKLTSLIPLEHEKKKIVKIEDSLQRDESPQKTENAVEPSEMEISLKLKLEELKSEITERIRFLNSQMAKNPNDPSNEIRTVECDTLNWVLRNIP